MADIKLHESAKSTTTKPKERHIVTWTQQEDDILRELITIHGAQNWGIIAANFNDKSSRQCRRRWFTYLNSDFKKGGWSAEEDKLLCKAQKIYGNKWTKIAKMVSGRTDNAVKNRFSTLCKKQAKREASSEENNNSSSIKSNNETTMLQNGYITNRTSESAPSLKKMRTYISDFTENCNLKGRLGAECRKIENHWSRPPFAVLVQNFHNVGDFTTQQHINSISTASNDGTFLKRDDPKITALMQQAELLSSLAVKVNTYNSNQSLENAWNEFQDFVKRTNESELLGYKIPETDFPMEDLVDFLKCGNMGSPLCWRQPGLYESPGSSEYSTGSTLQYHTASERTDIGQNSNLIFLERGDDGGGRGCEDGFTRSIHMEVENNSGGSADEFHTNTSVTQVVNLPFCEGHKVGEGVISSLPNTEFSSPLQATPVFRAIAAAIPSPKFSESERNFLMKTLGLESPFPNPSANPSQPPSCRRALLHNF